MPTGPKHLAYDEDDDVIDCRCTIGYDHNADGDAADVEDQRLDAYDAALIWASNGFDEDYTFGYSDDELRAALG